jgi:hypothetical protein
MPSVVYAECHDCFIDVLSVVMPSVIKFNVVALCHNTQHKDIPINDIQNNIK